MTPDTTLALNDNAAAVGWTDLVAKLFTAIRIGDDLNASAADSISIGIGLRVADTDGAFDDSFADNFIVVSDSANNLVEAFAIAGGIPMTQAEDIANLAEAVSGERLSPAPKWSESLTSSLSGAAADIQRSFSDNANNLAESNRFNHGLIISDVFTISDGVSTVPSVITGDDLNNWSDAKLIDRGIVLADDAANLADAFAPSFTKFLSLSDGIGGGYLGYTTATADNFLSPGYLVLLGPFTATENATASVIELDCTLDAVSSITVGIYNDSAGEPGTLRATSASREATSTGWNPFTLSSPTTLVAGTAYWIAVHSDEQIFINLANDTSNLGRGRYVAQAYAAGSLVTPFPGGALTLNGDINIRIAYTVGGVEWKDALSGASGQGKWRESVIVLGDPVDFFAKTFSEQMSMSDSAIVSFKIVKALAETINAFADSGQITLDSVTLKDGLSVNLPGSIFALANLQDDINNLAEAVRMGIGLQPSDTLNAWAESGIITGSSGGTGWQDAVIPNDIAPITLTASDVISWSDSLTKSNLTSGVLPLAVSDTNVANWADAFVIPAALLQLTDVIGGNLSDLTWSVSLLSASIQVGLNDGGNAWQDAGIPYLGLQVRPSDTIVLNDALGIGYNLGIVQQLTLDDAIVAIGRGALSFVDGYSLTDAITVGAEVARLALEDSSLLSDGIIISDDIAVGGVSGIQVSVSDVANLITDSIHLGFDILTIDISDTVVAMSEVLAASFGTIRIGELTATLRVFQSIDVDGIRLL